MRKKIGAILAVCGLAAASGVTAFGGSAFATGQNSANTNCGVGMFPVAEGSQSHLIANCNVDGSDAGSDQQVINDFNNVTWHNGACHLVKGSDTGAAIGASTETVNFTNDGSHAWTVPSDLNKTITWKGAPSEAFITNVGASSYTVTFPTATVAYRAGNVTACVENGPGRTVEDGVTTSGSAVLTSASANFNSNDVGLSITGTDIPNNTTISSVTNATTVHMSHNATASDTGQNVSIGSTNEPTSARVIYDGDTTKTSTTLSSASANFASTDVGLAVKGKGIKGYIVSVTDASDVVLSLAATATSESCTVPPAPHVCTPAANLTVIIGSPNGNAPTDGSPFGTLAAELPLSPALVSGSRPCSEDFPAGETIQGEWLNVDKFNTGKASAPTVILDSALTNAASHSPQVAQILFTTSVIDFAGYVVQHGSLGSYTYSVDFPFLPTGLALCSGDSTTESIELGGSTFSQGNFPTGWGRPGDDMTRGIRALTAAEASGSGHTATANVVFSTDETLDWTSSNSSCTVTRPAPQTFSTGWPCGK